MVIFHYGGHAREQEIFLNVDNGSAQFKSIGGIAGELGTHPELKLVFLNGCGTKEQVDLFFRKGVKAVLATKRPINDTAASQFASVFYDCLSKGDTIERAYYAAVRLAETEIKDCVTGINIRAVEEEGDESHDLDNENPYILFIQKEFEEEIKNFSLPRPNDMPKIPPAFSHNCNRSNQVDHFRSSFPLGGKCPFHFFVLHGYEEQSHMSMVGRFNTRFIRVGEMGNKSEVLTMDLDEIPTQEEYHRHILFKLADKARLKKGQTQKLIREEQPHILPIYNELRKKYNGAVTIHITVHSERWKSFTPDAIQWFIRDFCDIKRLDTSSLDNHLEVYFFLSIIYDKPKSKRGMLRLIKSPSARRKLIQTSLKKSARKIDFSAKASASEPGYILLEELQAVNKLHIAEWITDNISQFADDPENTKQEWMDRFFLKFKKLRNSNRVESYDMMDVQKILKEMIHEEQNSKNEA